MTVQDIEMASSQPNPAFNWEASNLEEEWKNFEEHAKLMFMGPLKKTSAEEQSAYLRIWIGETRRRMFKSWNLTEQDSKNTDILYNKFAEYTAPKKNTVFSCYKF